MMNRNLKKILTYAGVVLFFIVLAYATVPQVLSGKIVNQSDISGYQGMAHETNEWNVAHPSGPAYWTGSMFSGMPTTVITASGEGDWTQSLYNLLLAGKRPASYIFVSLLGAFLLMLSLGLSLPVAVGGAIAVTFCSYNFQIIQVGHNTKMQALAFLPWVLAALIFTYRNALSDKQMSRCKRFLRVSLGALLFAFALSFQVKANHQQITYYLALMILIFAIAELIWCIFKHRELLGRFFAASALLLVLGVAGIATNANKLIPVYKYTPYSIRGGSELADGDGTSAKGVDIDYATAWSYGWQELPNLFIPNYNGGSSSAAVNPDKSATVDLLRRAGQSNVREIAQALPMYWGPQPFTAGPMYMGAITIFLFILGLMLCKGWQKWWLGAATVLAILLAVGSHLLWFTKFFYDWAPFYSKFRTVSMALVVLQFTLPMLGFAALDRIARGKVSFEEFRLKGGIAAGISCGFALIVALIPSLVGSFSGAVDQGQPDVLIDALREDRRSLLVSDSLRSLLLVAAAFLLLLWSYGIKDSAKRLHRQHIAALLVCVVALADLFTVSRRYLNADDFISPKAFGNQFALRAADSEILKDSDPSYRVIDLSVNTFNDSHPSWWHKSIGGYSPAKLQRYQDLIEKYIQPEINTMAASMQGVATVSEFEQALPELPVLSALNTRYIIINGDIAPARNRWAYGNAWFVSDAVPAATPSEELGLLGSTDLRSTAVVGEDYWDCTASLAGLSSDGSEDELGKALAAIVSGIETSKALADSSNTIRLVSYSPNELRYEYNLTTEALTVFSEVFYPEGWDAWLDGDRSQSVDVFRADWVLRAAVLPAGKHELTMRFEPQTIRGSVAISRASSISIIVLLILVVAGMVYVRKEETV
jgi:uncharacterized membrane protein